jgi:hypothetical protein
MNKIKPVFVKTIPVDIQDGCLYISKEHGTAISKCPCGCGQQSILSLKPVFSEGWSINEENGSVTIRPSILNPCGAHYYITNNEIEWL